MFVACVIEPPAVEIVSEPTLFARRSFASTSLSIAPADSPSTLAASTILFSNLIEAIALSDELFAIAAPVVPVKEIVPPEPFVQPARVPPHVIAVPSKPPDTQ